MLRAITAATSTASAAPIPVREAQAAAASAGVGAQPSAVTPVEGPGPQASVTANPQTFRYNSTEFVYRQDIGRIVLIGQSPETGERRIQIPSEEALRAYERTMRAEEQRSLLAGRAQTSRAQTNTRYAQTPEPAPQTAPPNLSQALSAVFDSNQSGSLVSVSA